MILTKNKTDIVIADTLCSGYTYVVDSMHVYPGKTQSGGEVIIYDTYFTVENGATISNKIQITGDQIVEEEVVVQYSNGSGNGEGIPTALTIDKMDADREPIRSAEGSRAVFNLWNRYQDAKIVENVEVDENGRLHIPDIGYGTYYLEEVEAPEGYQKLDELIKLEIIYHGNGADEMIAEGVESGTVYETVDGILRVINEKIPKKIKIEGDKVWEDWNDYYRMHLDSIEIIHSKIWTKRIGYSSRKDGGVG